MVAPVCFHNFFFLNSSVHCDITRQSTCGDLFLANINKSQNCLKSIPFLGAELWDEFPIAIRATPSKKLEGSLIAGNKRVKNATLIYI